jgi:hypothetical protein
MRTKGFHVSQLGPTRQASVYPCCPALLAARMHALLHHYHYAAPDSLATSYAAQVYVYGMLDPAHRGPDTHRRAASKLPKGRRVAVIEPFYKVAADSSIMIRVDNPAEVGYGGHSATCMPHCCTAQRAGGSAMDAP